MDSELKQAEEAKRERNWSPLQRWHAILQTIAWAEAQQTPRRNSKEACLANQARILRSREASQAIAPPNE